MYICAVKIFVILIFVKGEQYIVCFLKRVSTKFGQNNSPSMQFLYCFVQRVRQNGSLKGQTNSRTLERKYCCFSSTRMSFNRLCQFELLLACTSYSRIFLQRNLFNAHILKEIIKIRGFWGNF